MAFGFVGGNRSGLWHVSPWQQHGGEWVAHRLCVILDRVNARLSAQQSARLDVDQLHCAHQSRHGHRRRGRRCIAVIIDARGLLEGVRVDNGYGDDEELCCGAVCGGGGEGDSGAFVVEVVTPH